MSSQVRELFPLLQLQMDEMTRLVSDLAVIATKENFMLGRCEDILASTAVMEVANQTKSKNLYCNVLTS